MGIAAAALAKIHSSVDHGKVDLLAAPLQRRRVLVGSTGFL
jgi:hypothetical protein